VPPDREAIAGKRPSATRDQRVELHKSGEIPASAGEVWALLTDWAGMMRWSLSAKRGGALGLLVGCELVGEADQVPRTRRMILSSGAVVEEELFYQNDATKRIYYRKTDTFGTRGYLASSYVEELGDRRSRLHILSWFDAEEDASAAAARYAAIYEGIFEGFTTYFAAPT
jgi:polyketide cyclase/dehydrase/lipid transport protein